MIEMKVLLVLLSNFDRSIIEELVSHISSYNLEVDLVSEYKYLPISAFDWDRLQYNAEKVIKYLRRIYNFNYDSIIFVAEADGYVDGYNFIFGLTIENTAIVFTSRLREEFYNRLPNLSLYAQRIVKEVTHELGHSIGLGHCNNEKCVMNFSNSIEDVDRKDKHFCKKCEYKINQKTTKYLQQR
ncbi:MAG: archaemetzincin family Zn-dependent metalloprotease [Saccharolobus sp.]